VSSSFSVSTAYQRLLGPAFDDLSNGLVLVGAPPTVGKTCLSLNLAAHVAGALGERVLYYSPVTPKEVIVARLAKNLATDEGAVDLTVVADLPLTIVDVPNPSSGWLSEFAQDFVAQHGVPALILVNDLQSLKSPHVELDGHDAAIAIMADLRAIAQLCDAPVILFSQLAEGRTISATIRQHADRVVTVNLDREDPSHKYLSVVYMDPPDPDASSYELVLARETGVLRLG